MSLFVAGAATMLGFQVLMVLAIMGLQLAWQKRAARPPEATAPPKQSPALERVTMSVRVAARTRRIVWIGEPQHFFAAETTELN